MEDMFGKINRLLDLEKTRLERKLKSFLVRKQELLDKADACENAPRNVQRSSSEMDVATAMAMYKWLTAQGGRAEKFRAEAELLNPAINKLKSDLKDQIKRQEGVSQLQARAKAKERLLAEEREDDSMLSISQLTKNRG